MFTDTHVVTDLSKNFSVFITVAFSELLNPEDEVNNVSRNVRNYQSA
jgi:hypothetical protein